MRSFLLMIFLTFLLQNKVDLIQYDEYAVEMDMDILEANLDFSLYNIEVIRKVSALGNVYHLEHKNSCKTRRCKRDVSESILKILNEHPMIHRVEKQVDLEVELKELEYPSEYFYDDKNLNEENQKNIIEEFQSNFDQMGDEDVEVEVKPINNDKSILKTPPKKRVEGHKEGDSEKENLSKDDKEYLNLVKEREYRNRDFFLNDPQFGKVWQYNNNGQYQGANPGFDMNIFNVLKANITGRGIVITVIDDGIDTRNIELKNNFDPAASLDLNDPRNVNGNPRGPNYIKEMPSSDGHGTLCASIIAAEANNSVCSFGISHKANLGGIRMLAKAVVTDLLEAFSLTHNNQYIDVYSNSWGPKDTGNKTAPVTHYVQKALKTGAHKGRSGKGSIYLFAAGNGGFKNDHCGADGMVNSPYTIGVTSTNIYGRKPIYTEECSAISITAAVGGVSIDNLRSVNPLLISSGINNKCYKQFVGTSAATPMVSGCVGLALEANPTLSWRDIQHLFPVSARIPNPVESVWQMNSVGFLISHVYGFGLLDCTALVRNAQMWRNVGELRICVGGASNSTSNLKIRAHKRTRIAFQTVACENTNNAIDRLEHVIIHTKIQHICRGDLAITLTSPTKTLSFLLKNRKLDVENGTIAFSFLSLMNWGENPKGMWYLDILDIGKCGNPKVSEERGKILKVVLEFYGTSEKESAAYKNDYLFDNFFQSTDIKKPKESTILNENQLYNYYNNQRKHFIKLTTLHHQVIFVKNKFDRANSNEDKKSIEGKIVELKNKIPEDQMKFLNSLLYNKRA